SLCVIHLIFLETQQHPPLPLSCSLLSALRVLFLSLPSLFYLCIFKKINANCLSVIDKQFAFFYLTSMTRSFPDRRATMNIIVPTPINKISGMSHPPVKS